MDQYLICLMNIPHPLKHIKLESVRLWNNKGRRNIPNMIYELRFCVHILIKTKHNFNFEYNNDVGISMRIQKWTNNWLENMMKQGWLWLYWLTNKAKKKHMMIRRNMMTGTIYIGLDFW
jgi:hypothetical protein